MSIVRNIILSMAVVVACAGLVMAEQPPEHFAIACANCHGPHGDDPYPIDAQCLSCHASSLPEATQIAGVFHAGDDLSCSSCHGYHSTEHLKARGATFDRSFGEMAVRNHCAACHRSDGTTADISAGHVTASDRYHVDASALAYVSVSTACQTCHDETSSEPDTPYGTPTFAVHGSHSVGVGIPVSSPYTTSAFRRDLAPDIKLFESKMECTTCHRLTADTESRLVPFTNYSDLCRGCHDMAPGIRRREDLEVRPFMVADGSD